MNYEVFVDDNRYSAFEFTSPVELRTGEEIYSYDNGWFKINKVGYQIYNGKVSCVVLTCSKIN